MSAMSLVPQPRSDPHGSAFKAGATPANAPIANEALQRIGALYEIEAEIRERSSDERRAVRKARSGPIIEALKPWLENQLRPVSGRSAIAQAKRYGVSRGMVSPATSMTAALRSTPTWLSDRSGRSP